MKRYIDWDVDGLSVWCDDCPPRPSKEHCDECEEVHELERDWTDYDYGWGKKPSKPRPEGIR